MLSAEPKAEDDNTYRDLDYLGYHKNIMLLYKMFEKKIMTNTPSQGTWIGIIIGSHALCTKPTD